MRIRIKQIECRFSQGRYEIVKWFPNCYYGKEQEYVDNGYVLSGGFYRNANVSISESCFENPESCCTIATLHYDDSEGCCDMHTVGSRLLDLDKQERADFFAVYEYAEDRIREEELNKEQENEY
jgi:hypothetical protein